MGTGAAQGWNDDMLTYEDLVSDDVDARYAWHLRGFEPSFTEVELLCAYAELSPALWQAQRIRAEQDRLSGEEWAARLERALRSWTPPAPGPGLDPNDLLRGLGRGENAVPELDAAGHRPRGAGSGDQARMPVTTSPDTSVSR